MMGNRRTVPSLVPESVRKFPARLIALPGNVRLAMIITADVLACILSTFVAFYLRIGDPYLEVSAFAILVALALTCWFAFAWLQDVYKIMLRYFGWDGMERIGFAILLTSAVMTFVLLSAQFVGIPRTLAVIQPMVFMIFLIVNRVVVSFLLLRSISGNPHAGFERREVLVYGTGQTAMQLAEAIRREPGFILVGVVDPDDKHGGRHIGTIPIFNDSELERLLVEQPIENLFLAARSMQRPRRLRLVERIAKIDASLTIKELPVVSDIVSGEIELSDLKPIAIEDLLGRDPVEPLPELLAPIHDSRVLVTGAGGSIGSELCRLILTERPAVLILADNGEYNLYRIDQELRETEATHGYGVSIETRLLDLTDPKSTDRLFVETAPDRVFHAAAYKHVPLVEHNVVAGTANNIRSTRNVLAACEDHGVGAMTLVSTDKAVRPTNVMGASKRVCELILQSRAAAGSAVKLNAVRFGNVLGSSGSVVPKFERQIAQGGPVTLTHADVTRYFMTIPEAASLVVQAGSMGTNGEIYLLDMGDPVRIGDLAHTMIELAGRSVRNAAHPEGDIEIIETGLRPGEKLFEELLIDASAEPTRHDRIVKARERGLDWPKMEKALAGLEDAFARNDDGAVLAILSDLVPGYGERVRPRDVA
ncbi:nucleoside-diphosphate sugar epimerase/dehydratase [Sphingomicrobium sp. XHP0235]|uniref:polysaccharide biosynthesis protein n=1 Tax=Sphingomicrobium aquimarinum TaxID=3133971 RepID=UPI0031FEF0EC